MAPNKLDMSVFINPPQCANNNKQVDGVLEVCQKSATQCCGSCHLVQVHFLICISLCGSHDC